MMRALDLAEAVDAGDLTPAAIVELCAERIAEHEKRIQAFAHLDLERARLEAGRVKADRGLYGLPIGFKDIIDTAGMPTRYGSAIYARHQPKADAAIVVMSEAAGGIPLGKMATTEFANLHPASTVNPHHPEHTPGGSSAGSAAGVAAGMLPLAFGTQTAGSVIRPASFCGVAAIKPSYRLLPMVGVKPVSPLLDTLGLFGARVVDIAFGLEAISGRRLRVDDEDFGRPCFGITRLPIAGGAAPEAHAALDDAIRALEKAGARLVNLELPDGFAEAQAAFPILMEFEMAQSLAYEYRHHRARLSESLLGALDRGQSIGVAEFDAARSIANRARKAARGLFADVDAILTFSAPGAAPGRETTGDSRFNRLVSLLGLPAVNVPFARTAEGLPVGLQIVGAFGDDRRALAAAHFLETLAPVEKPAKY